MRHILLLLCVPLLSVLAIPCLAYQKPRSIPPPDRPPTGAEMRLAYDLTVKQIMALAVNPESIRISIDKAWFSIDGQVKGQDIIKMYVVFSGQNSFGAMVRQTAVCRINASKELSMCGTPISGDLAALGMIPKNMVQVAQKEEPAKE